jgi:hypothetical protein
VPGEAYVGDVIFNGEVFLVSGARDPKLVNEYQSVFWRSTDGISWSLIEPGSTDCGGSVAHGAAGYVAVDRDGFCHSADGRTWTRFDQYVGDDIAYGGGVYMAVGWNWTRNEGQSSFAEGDAVFHYSTDGVTWTSVTGEPELFGRADSCGNDFPVQAISVAYWGDRFVVAGTDNSVLWWEPWPCAGAELLSYVWVGEPTG